jgi:hypothetical protein
MCYLLSKINKRKSKCKRVLWHSTDDKDDDDDDDDDNNNNNNNNNSKRSIRKTL